MKLKLKINNIESGSDTIKIIAYNKKNVIEEFKKEDYGEDWEGLKGKEIYINPYFVGDVNQLKVIGTKSHDLSWDDEEKKNLWKEYASDKFDISISPYGREDLDMKKIIKVTNYRNVNNYSTGESIQYLLEKSNTSNALFDLSKFPGDIFYSNDVYNSCNISKIYKLPNISDGITNLGRSSTDSFKSLVDISNLDTKNIVDMEKFLHDNTTIEDISNLNFDSLEDGYRSFYNCTNLKKLPPLVFPKLKNSENMFMNCNNLDPIDLIDFSKSSNVFSEQFRYIFSNITVNKIILGKSYLTIPSYANFGVVNIGNSREDILKEYQALPSSRSSLFYDGGTAQVKAFPYALMTNSLARSELKTPPENPKIIWVDSTPSTYNTYTLKSIIVPNYNGSSTDISKDIKTLKNKFIGQIELPNFFKVNPDYPYDFKLLDINFKECSAQSVNPKVSGLKCNSASFVVNEEGKCFINLDLSEITDGSTLYFYYNPNNAIYTALIDGEEFIGKCFLGGNLSFKLTFKIEENLDFGFELVEDSSDDTTE